GDEFRLRLHPRRRFRISPPPMAKSRRRHCRSAAVIATSYTRDARYGNIATHGQEFRFWLHPRRRFRISSPPVEILLRPDGPSAAFIAPSRTQHARYRHFSTHGDEFRLRLHPRWRFGISRHLWRSPADGVAKAPPSSLLALLGPAARRKSPPLETNLGGNSTDGDDVRLDRRLWRGHLGQRLTRLAISRRTES